MGDVIDEERAKDLRGKKKLQHCYTSFLSRYADIEYEDQVKAYGTPLDKDLCIKYTNRGDLK